MAGERLADLAVRSIALREARATFDREATARRHVRGEICSAARVAASNAMGPDVAELERNAGTRSGGHASARDVMKPSARVRYVDVLVARRLNLVHLPADISAATRASEPLKNVIAVPGDDEEGGVAPARILASSDALCVSPRQCRRARRRRSPAWKRRPGRCERGLRRRGVHGAISTCELPSSRAPMALATPATNALRKLGVSFELRSYDYDPDAASVGLHAAQALGEPPSRVLKTLIVQVDGKPACIVLPSDREASMKKVAAAFGGKSAALMPVADAERSSGYKVGGVSPFGQRRKLRTVIETAALDEACVYVNGGQRGLQIRLAPADLLRAAEAQAASIVGN